MITDSLTRTKREFHAWEDATVFDFDLRPLIVFAVLGLTFGLWKLGELVWWFFSHISWN